MERSGTQIIRRLREEGFELVSVKGSHHKYRKDDRTIIVPHSRKDLPVATARSIARMAGWI